MSASTNDKITDVRNAARPNSARVTSGRSAGGATLACDNLSGWPTASKVHFVTYKVDSNSAVVSGTQLDCYGIVSGNNIGSFTVVDGTDTGHAVGDYVEMLPTAAWGQDLADALSVGHARTGAHASALPLTSPVLTTPVVADFTSATHTHANAAGGGQLNGHNAITAGTLTSAEMNLTVAQVLNSGNYKIQSGTAVGSNAADVTVTYGVAFSAAPILLVSFVVTVGGSGFVAIQTQAAATFSFATLSSAAVRVAGNCNWLAVGT